MLSIDVNPITIHLHDYKILNNVSFVKKTLKSNRLDIYSENNHK